MPKYDVEATLFIPFERDADKMRRLLVHRAFLPVYLGREAKQKTGLCSSFTLALLLRATRSWPHTTLFSGPQHFPMRRTALFVLLGLGAALAEQAEVHVEASAPACTIETCSG